MRHNHAYARKNDTDTSSHSLFLLSREIKALTLEIEALFSFLWLRGGKEESLIKEEKLGDCIYSSYAVSSIYLLNMYFFILL